MMSDERGEISNVGKVSAFGLHNEAPLVPCPPDVLLKWLRLLMKSITRRPRPCWYRALHISSSPSFRLPTME